MNIYKYTPGKTLHANPSFIALGFFDGVHIGHRRLLQSARSLAKKLSLEFTVFTFPSEKSIFKASAPLYTTDSKLKILESLGAENVIIADLEEISDIPAEDFLKNSLYGDMNCRGASAGYDFKFGKNRGGDARLLKKTFEGLGAFCIIEDEVKAGGEKVSSTRIRSLLLSGDAEGAWRLLGIPYFIEGKAAHGRGVGRSLGFPTVNSDFKDFAPPLKIGVYRTVSMISGVPYSSITNIGICPTFDIRSPHAETHIIDFDGDLYGENVRTFFLDYLRDEVRFNTEKELIMQINVDKNTTITKNGELKWQEIGLNLP